MRALVTGGAGFIGSHLTALLIEEGYEVTVIDDLSSGKRSHLKSLSREPRFAQVDIGSDTDLLPHMEGVDHLFHLAARADVIPSMVDPASYYKTNVTGTFNLLECARKAGVKRFIYAASASCYGLNEAVPLSESAPISPQHPYALTKYLGEELVLKWHQIYQLPTLSLRLFNVYGERQVKQGSYGGVFAIFLPQKLHNRPLTIVGDGMQTRDYIYVKDVARAFLMAALSPYAGEVFNVGRGEESSINTIAQLLCHPTIHLPQRGGEPKRSCSDSRKIERMLGFQATTPLEKGVLSLLSTIEDFREGTVWEPQLINEALKGWKILPHRD